MEREKLDNFNEEIDEKEEISGLNDENIANIDSAVSNETDEKIASSSNENDESSKIIEDYKPTTKIEKTPLFVLDEKKPGCIRNDKILLVSKKIGFFGIIIFLILSIISGVVMQKWENSLNLLFMGLAVLSYGVQNILHFIAISKCKCSSCVEQISKLKTLSIVCIVVFVALEIVFVLKQIGIINF